MGVFAIRKAGSLFPLWGLSLAFLCLFLPALSGCHYTEGVSVTIMPEGGVVLNRLAVLPFREIIPEDEAAKMVSCPLCGAVFNTDKFTDASLSVASVENIFLESLQEHKKLTLLAPDSTAEVYRRVTASLKVPLPEIFRRVGAELEADGILIGYVFRYRERKGYTYSVEKPASVAFDIHLVRASDGLVVWRGAFDYTQSTLMEDIFQLSAFYKRGGKWSTARELTKEGVAELLKTFPGIN